MKISIAFISVRGSAKSAPAEALADGYVARARRLAEVDAAGFDNEKALLTAAERATGRNAAQLLLFDSRGEMLTSEGFAELLGRLRDGGTQRVMCCTGPADGWSKEALGKASRVLALGRMTLPHELARVVVAEQVYRALTILAGLPYHCGH